MISCVLISDIFSSAAKESDIVSISPTRNVDPSEDCGSQREEGNIPNYQQDCRNLPKTRRKYVVLINENHN